MTSSQHRFSFARFAKKKAISGDDVCREGPLVACGRAWHRVGGCVRSVAHVSHFDRLGEASNLLRTRDLLANPGFAESALVLHSEHDPFAASSLLISV